jgi:hypothetical protein
MNLPRFLLKFNAPGSGKACSGDPSLPPRLRKRAHCKPARGHKRHWKGSETEAGGCALGFGGKMMAEFTEGVCEDGAAILCDGVPITISEVLETLNASSDMLAVLTHVRVLGERYIADRKGREFGGGKTDSREMFGFPWHMTAEIDAAIAKAHASIGRARRQKREAVHAALEGR